MERSRQLNGGSHDRHASLQSAVWLCLAIVLNTAFLAAADEVDDALATIAKAGPEGTGSVEARKARDRLADQGTDILPKLLAAMDTKNLVAANWCRTAYEEITARELAQDSPDFPLEALKTNAADPARQGRVRRLTLALLDRLEPSFRAELIPTLLDDPEFRTDAVQAALDAGAKAEAADEREQAIAEYRKAFEHSRAADQATRSAARLKALGEEADIVAHLGFVVDWRLLGPFDAPEYSGFAQIFPPEEEQPPDFRAEYAGKNGKTIHWRRFRTDDPLGQLNLIDAVAPVREAVGFAYSEFDSPREIDAQLRCGADDNCTVWLNGERVFGREQWLNGTRLDRFRAPVHLRQGKNGLLVKICQGPQHKDPQVPNNWSLQLRFCDETGVGLGLTSALSAECEGK
ncbi:MAG TPA: hypothetical protein VHC19_18320 [Pirellulales bacterium]|nr:hypothetical protein [Pirellulales bacterium]